MAAPWADTGATTMCSEAAVRQPRVLGQRSATGLNRHDRCGAPSAPEERTFLVGTRASDLSRFRVHTQGRGLFVRETRFLF